MLAACGLIHLNTSWINSLLRELLDHRLADPQEVIVFSPSFLYCFELRVCGALVGHNESSALRVNGAVTGGCGTAIIPTEEMLAEKGYTVTMTDDFMSLHAPRCSWVPSREPCS